MERVWERGPERLASRPPYHKAVAFPWAVCACRFCIGARDAGADLSEGQHSDGCYSPRGKLACPARPAVNPVGGRNGPTVVTYVCVPYGRRWVGEWAGLPLTLWGSVFVNKRSCRMNIAAWGRLDVQCDRLVEPI